MDPRPYPCDHVRGPRRECQSSRILADRQRWPRSDVGVRVTLTPISRGHTRVSVIECSDPEKRRAALLMIENFEEEIAQGQRQLFLREDDYYTNAALQRDTVKMVFDLLRR